jgi:hypothetical protein
LGAVGGALSAQRAQVGGVAARLGDEVPAEAEHVHPPGQPSQAGALAKAQHAVGHPDELLGHAPLTPAFRIGVAGGDLLVTCLAGVLGHVRRDLLRRQLSVTVPAAREHTGVQLLTEPQLDRPAVTGIPVQ